MLEKLKQFGLAAKNAVIYVVAPILAFFVYVLFLRDKNTDLKQQLESEKAAGKLKELENDKKHIDADASDADDEYKRLRDDYLRERDSGVRPGSGDEGGAA